MASIWDYIAQSIIDQAGPLIDSKLPELEAIFRKAIREELKEFFTVNPVPVPTPALSPQGETITVFDLNLVPERMRFANFAGSDNALYYALAHVACFGPEANMPDDDAGSMIWLNVHGQEIYNWWIREVNLCVELLRTSPQVKAVVIANDGRDRCGFRLGPPTLTHFKEFGDRVILGDIFPESEY